MAIIEVKVPDIGDFKDVAVIELLVKVGDTVKVDQSLITVESDKASMEIPSSHAGVVKELKLKVGDVVNQGSLVLSLEAAEAAAPAPAAAPASPAAAVAAAVPAPQAASYSGSADAEYDVLVLGGGPGGYSAAFRAADLGLKVVLVERYASLGGVCLNVGCIPSKALLHVAAVMDEVSHMADLGVDFGAPSVNIDKLRGHKEKVIGKLTGGLAQMAKMRKVTVVRGYGSFVGANHLEVEETSGSGQDKTGGKTVLAFKRAIIAAGSQAVRLPFFPQDDRIVDSTGALALKEVPKKMLIVGGGIIGLEMGTVYSTLGA
ncbi:MAG: FAD-dependent oxidoreductase, partial [Roseateles sp.]